MNNRLAKAIACQRAALRLQDAVESGMFTEPSDYWNREQGLVGGSDGPDEPTDDAVLVEHHMKVLIRELHRRGEGARGYSVSPQVDVPRDLFDTLLTIEEG